MSSLPARLDQTGDLAVIAEITQRDTRNFELAVIRARTPGHFAAIADTVLGRVARHGRKLQLGAKALFHRLGLVHDDRLEGGTPCGVLIHELAAVVILLD